MAYSRLIFIILATLNAEALALFRMNKFQCENLNESIARLDYCNFKLIDRETSIASFRYYLYKKVDDVDFRVRLMKKNDVGVYRTFFVDQEIDFCEFVKNPKRHPTVEIIYNLLKDYLNINHPCPYEGFVILENFTTQHRNLKYPLPNGNFKLDIVVSLWKMNTIGVTGWFDFKGLRGQELI